MLVVSSGSSVYVADVLQSLEQAMAAETISMLDCSMTGLFVLVQ
jgi:hypothetical protein